jgi:hypothetical protein
MIAGYHPNISIEDYLADPAPEPSLSKGDIWTIINRTLKRAHAEHPRFGNRQSSRTPRGEIGSATHAYALGGQPVVFCDALDPRGEVASDWKTNAAKKFRDDAFAAKQVPLLEKQRGLVEAVGNGARAALAAFGEGQNEVTMIFQFEGVWFRGRCDRLTNEYDLELKTCEDADAYDWARRTVQSSGYDLQMGLRYLGHKILGHERKMKWLLQEIENDLETVSVNVGARMLSEAERQIRYAAKLWRGALDGGQWPGHKQDQTVEPSTSAAWNLEERGVP